MAYSTQRTTSDGTLVLLDISIEYFDRSEIAVLFNGVVGAYPWAWVGDTEKKISFSPAVPNTVEVMLVRTTDLAAVRHMFTLGAQFTTQSLDEDLLQILHIAQEAKENATIEEVFHNLNMHGYRITTIGDGIDPQDAASIAQMVVHDAQIVVYKDAAAASAAAAAASAAGAAVSEANAAAAVPTVVNAGGTNAVLRTSSTGAAQLPAGTTAQRPVGPSIGHLRWNSTLVAWEGWDGTSWVEIPTASGFATLTGVQTLTNKTLTAPKLDQLQLGISGTATKNFTFTAAAIDGTMKLARGNAGATTQDILTVDADGKVSFPQNTALTVYTTAVTPLPSASAVVAVSHSLGVVPSEAVLEMTCLTAEFGYSVGDVVQMPHQWNGVVLYPTAIWKSTTQCGFTLLPAYVLYITNKSSNANQTPTAANWSYRFRLRTS